MNPWPKTIVVGVATTVAFFTLLFVLPIFIPALKPDPFGEAIKPIIFMLAFGLQFLALLSAWICQRWVFKWQNRYGLSVLLAAFISFGAFLLFLGSFCGELWSLEDFEVFGIWPAILCGIPLFCISFFVKNLRDINL